MNHGGLSRRNGMLALALGVCMTTGLTSGRENARPIAHLSFDDEKPEAAPGLPPGRLQGATRTEGHQGKALAFEDWSTRDYLKPNPAQAARLVIPHDARLNPALPFSLSAWIYPTADPIYYGGIVEKGQGFGGSYRLLLLRGLKVAGSAGAKNTTVRSAQPLTLNAWHELKLVAAAGTLTLYVDGQKAGEAALPEGSRPAASDDFVIGDRFTGRIDEVILAAGP